MRLVMLVLGVSIALIHPALAVAPVITSFSPAAGTIGTSVAIVGTGLTGAKAVTIGGAAATFKLTGSTRIVATAPLTVAAGTIKVTTPTGTATSKTTFTVTPGAQLVPAAGPALTVTRVYGAGFPPSTAVDVYFDTTDQALAVTTAKGLISLQFQVPAGTQPGLHTVSLVARGSEIAAQASYNVISNWPMAGFDTQGRGFNSFENTLTTANVGSLTDIWTKSAGGAGNPSPFVVANGTVFLSSVTGQIYAYSSSGALLWTASAGGNFHVITPVVAAGRVFIGADNGNVYAYAAACRTDGGVCAPIWTTSVGTSVTASLNFYQGLVYAPANDGKVHTLNPTTGVAGTPLAGIDTSHGSVTTPVSFGTDGSYFYATGATLEAGVGGGGTSSTLNGTVSPIAVYGGIGFFTTADGYVHEGGGAGWTVATSGNGCAPAPAIANGLVFAGGCTTLSAFELGHGTLRWSATTAGAVIGVSVANGVVYACISTGSGFEGVLSAYAATYGGLLWSGGDCSGGAPEVVNGTLYSAFVRLTAYRLPGFQPDTVARTPDARRLRPDYRLRPGVQPAFKPVEAGE